MKLNKYIRSAFVRAAMNDVPMVDYQQQARDLALTTAISLLPAEVLAVYDNPSTRDWIKEDYVYMPGSLSGLRVPVKNDTCYYLRDHAPAAWAQLDELARLDKEQNQRRKALEEKLIAAAASVTTRKALAKLLPEFEKYLPAESAPAITQLPACANLVSDFVQAGWPKSDKK